MSENTTEATAEATTEATAETTTEANGRDRRTQAPQGP